MECDRYSKISKLSTYFEINTVDMCAMHIHKPGLLILLFFHYIKNNLKNIIFDYLII